MDNINLNSVIRPFHRLQAGAVLSGWAVCDWWLVVWRNRKLLSALVHRDIKARYRGSILGMAWLVGTPLVMMVVYTVIFAGVFKVSFAGGNFGVRGSALAIWLGTTVWQTISESVIRSTGCLQENVPYVKRIPFPLPLLSVMGLATSVIGFSVSMLLMIIVYFFIIGVPPLTLLFFPVVIAPIFLLSLGVGWLMASAGAYVRDLRHLVPMVMTLSMFATPVLYPASAVPAKISWMLRVNPLSPLFEALRDVVFSGVLPGESFWIASLVSVVIAMIGYGVFRFHEWEYADVV